MCENENRRSKINEKKTNNNNNKLRSIKLETITHTRLVEKTQSMQTARIIYWTVYYI